MARNQKGDGIENDEGGALQDADGLIVQAQLSADQGSGDGWQGAIDRGCEMRHRQQNQKRSRNTSVPRFGSLSANRLNF